MVSLGHRRLRTLPDRAATPTVRRSYGQNQRAAHPLISLFLLAPPVGRTQYFRPGEAPGE